MQLPGATDEFPSGSKKVFFEGEYAIDDVSNCKNHKIWIGLDQITYTHFEQYDVYDVETYYRNRSLNAGVIEYGRISRPDKTLAFMMRSAILEGTNDQIFLLSIYDQIPETELNLYILQELSPISRIKLVRCPQDNAMS